MSRLREREKAQRVGDLATDTYVRIKIRKWQDLLIGRSKSPTQARD